MEGLTPPFEQSSHLGLQPTVEEEIESLAIKAELDLPDESTSRFTTEAEKSGELEGEDKETIRYQLSEAVRLEKENVSLRQKMVASWNEYAEHYVDHPMYGELKATENALKLFNDQFLEAQEVKEKRRMMEIARLSNSFLLAQNELLRMILQDVERGKKTER